MRYANSTRWNAWWLGWLVAVHGRYTGWEGVVKTWIGFTIVVGLAMVWVALFG